MSGKFELISLICVPLAGAIISLLLDKFDKRKIGNIICVLTIVTELLLISYFLYEFYDIYGGNEAIKLSIDKLFGFGMYIAVDGFRGIFGITVAFMWLFAMIFANKYLEGSNFHFWSLIVLMATMGIVLSDNLFTTFVFFEIMSLSSYPWVAFYGTHKDMKAAKSYLIYAVAGGLVTLVGILMLKYKLDAGKMVVLDSLSIVTNGNTDGYNVLDYTNMKEIISVNYFAGTPINLFAESVLVIFGFAIKAGAFPLHTWLEKTYVAAPAPLTALLSSILSKTGIIGMAVISTRVMFLSYDWGIMLIILGLATMILGGLYGMAATNMKKIVAYSSMTHLGYIVVGLGGAMALGNLGGYGIKGMFIHMLNHSVFKMIFFLIIGLIAVDRGRNLELDKIQGWGKNKTFLKVIYLVAMLGISGVPFLSGYVSKTYTHEVLVQLKHISMETPSGQGLIYSTGFITALEVLFLVGGGCTIAYMLKIFVVVFLKNPKDKEIEDSNFKVSKSVGVILAILTSLIVICGIIPGRTLEVVGEKGIPFFGYIETERISLFGMEALKGSLISLSIGLVMYFAFAMHIKRRIVPEWLNIETLIYKPIILGVLPTVGTFFMRILDWSIEGPAYLLRKTVLKDNSIEPKTKKVHYKINKVRNTGNFLSKSVSFGLFMFSIGFIATIVYLIWLMISGHIAM